MNLYISLKPEPQSLKLLRQTTKNFFSNICQIQAQELITALSEAASNCILHAHSLFCVYLKIDNTDTGQALVTIRVSDFSGKFFDGNNYSPPLPGTFEGKMGVLIMRSIMDNIRWFEHEKGTTVEMFKMCDDNNKLKKSLDHKKQILSCKAS